MDAIARLSLLKTSAALCRDVAERRRTRILLDRLKVNDGGPLAESGTQHPARSRALPQASGIVPEAPCVAAGGTLSAQSFEANSSVSSWFVEEHAAGDEGQGFQPAVRLAFGTWRRDRRAAMSGRRACLRTVAGRSRDSNHLNQYEVSGSDREAEVQEPRTSIRLRRI